MKDLRTLRNDKHLTQAQLARMAGVSARAYRNYEAGRRKPPYETAKALAKALKVPMEQLF